MPSNSASRSTPEPTSTPAPTAPQSAPKAVAWFASLGKRLGILIPLAMIAGFITGALVDLTPLSKYITVLTMLMVYPMMVGFKPKEALDRENAQPVSIAMGLNFLVLPLVAWALAMIFFRDSPALFAGMVLAGLFPTSGMTISWTGFAKGNLRAAVSMTVIGLILASLLAPLYLKVLAGAVVEVDVLGVLRTVLLVIVIPMIAGTLTRLAGIRALGKSGFQRIAPVFPGLSTLGVLAIVFIAVGMRAPMILKDPLLLARVLVPVIIFYAINYAVAIVIGRKYCFRGDAIAVVYGTVMRNLSIALGLAMASFGPEAALILAAAFIVQVQSAAWMVKAMEPMFDSCPIREEGVTPTGSA